MKQFKEFKIIFADANTKDYLEYRCKKCNKGFCTLETFLNHFVQEHMCKLESKP